ncbi:MAG: hypothetical protein R3C28_22195 [Pirellulaceae bacterium]
MVRNTWFIHFAFIFMGLALLAGCPASDTPGESSDANATAMTEEEAEIQEALAKLSDEDRALAEAQKLCPVSLEPLGSMGTPLKVEAGDHAIFICCEGCRKPVVADPEGMLAKLANHAAGDQQ